MMCLTHSTVSVRTATSGETPHSPCVAGVATHIRTGHRRHGAEVKAIANGALREDTLWCSRRQTVWRPPHMTNGAA